MYAGWLHWERGGEQFGKKKRKLKGRKKHGKIYEYKKRAELAYWTIYCEISVEGITKTKKKIWKLIKNHFSDYSGTKSKL